MSHHSPLPLCRVQTGFRVFLGDVVLMEKQAYRVRASLMPEQEL